MRDSRRTRAVLVVLVLVSLTLIALNGNSGPGRALRSGAGALFGPVQRVAASAFRPIHDFFGGIGKDTQAKIDALRRRTTRCGSRTAPPPTRSAGSASWTPCCTSRGSASTRSSPPR